MSDLPPVEDTPVTLIPQHVFAMIFNPVLAPSWQKQLSLISKFGFTHSSMADTHMHIHKLYLYLKLKVSQLGVI